MSVALHAAHLHTLNSAHSLPVVARWSVGFAVMVTKWDTNRRTRLHLKTLSPHLLKDIGVNQHAANTEARKPFWQA